MGSSEAPISRTYLFHTSAILCSGICRNGSETASYSAWPRRRQAVSEHNPRLHPRTCVSLRADVRGHLVHSNSHLAMALQEETGLPLRRNLLLGLRTLLLRITENKGRCQAIQEHFSASLEKRCLRSSHTVVEDGLNFNGARRIYLSTQPHTCHNPMQINPHLR